MQISFKIFVNVNLDCSHTLEYGLWLPLIVIHFMAYKVQSERL